MLNNNIIFRLHLVRHAETEANEVGIVLGQIDSPLTKLGVKQSIAAHHEYGGGILGTSTGTGTGTGTGTRVHDDDYDVDNDGGKYWKVFSSDLERCKTTSRLILFGSTTSATTSTENDKNRNGIAVAAAATNNINTSTCSTSTNIVISSNHNHNHNNNNNNTGTTTTSTTTTTVIHLDKRLRERAKGAREGQSKHLTYSEALELFQQNAQKQGKIFRESDIPLLETELEVLDRFQDWLEETLADALHHYHYCNSRRNCNDNDSTNDNTNANVDTSPEQKPSNIYNVLAISHSGTLRVIFEKLIGDQTPSNAEREEEGINVFGNINTSTSKNSGRLMIPNTSKSIIEFTRMISTTCGSRSDVHNKLVVEKNTNSDENEMVKIKTRGGGVDVEEGDEICWRPRLLDYMNTKHFRKIK